MSAKRRRLQLFDIRPEEYRTTTLFFVFSFVMGVSFNFLETTAFPLFLNEFGAQTLPYIYIINAFVVSLITSIYLRLGRHLSFSRVLVVNLGFLFVSLSAFRLGLGLENAHWVIFALPILFQIVVSLGAIAYWTLAGRVFNVRQAKRLFGLLGAGMWMAIVITGFIIPIVVRLIGTANMLIIAALSMAVALALLLYILRSSGDQLAEAEVRESKQEQRSTASLLKNRYILLMFSLSVVAWIAFFFVDNIFYNRVESQFSSPDQVASFLGIYLAILGILTLVVTTFVSAPVINRFGVGTGLMVLPVALLAGTVLFAGTGTLFGLVSILFVFATLNKLLDLSLGFSIDQSAQTILYQPLPARERSSVQTIDEGMVRMVAIGTAGVLLILLNNIFNASVVHLSYVLLVVMIVWIVAVVLVNREYPQALMQALVKRKLSGTVLEINDESSLSILRQAAESPHPGIVFYSLDNLESNAPDSLADLLPSLLNHPVPEIRQDVAGRIERSAHTSALPALRKRLAVEQSPAVRAALLHAMAVLGAPDLPDLASTDLAHPDPLIKRGAISALLQQGEPAAIAISERALQAMITSADPEQRAGAARALADASEDVLRRYIDTLLNDPDVSVRRAALITAGEAHYVWLWPEVVSRITDPLLRSTAAAALVQGGEGTLPAIQQVLAEQQVDQDVLVRLARVCGRIGGGQATDLLLTRLDYPDPNVRNQVITSLKRSDFQPSRDQRPQLENQINVEVASAAYLLTAQMDLQEQEIAGEDDEAIQFLLQALEGQLEQAKTRIIFLLSFLYGSTAMQPVQHGLVHASPEQRAYALEVLDITLSSTLKGSVMPLFEEIRPEERLRRLNQRFPQTRMDFHQRLRELAGSRDAYSGRWHRACALYTLGRLKVSGTDTVEPLVQAIDTTDPLIRESGQWALNHMDQPTIDSCCLELAKEAGTDFESVQLELIAERRGDIIMLSTIEKVINLKTVELFKDTPDEVMVSIASVLDETFLEEGATIFEKGDQGDSMYIVVSGSVNVHDGPTSISTLGEGEVFGEMALLDPEPRMASVTAIEHTHLLRLDREPFLELLEDRIEVTRGVIRVLTGRLRNC